MLYFSDKMVDKMQLEKYLIEDLRMETKDLTDFNLKKVKKLGGLYGHNVKLFYNLLENVK